MGSASEIPGKEVVDEEYGRLYASLESNLKAGRDAGLKDAQPFLQKMISQSRTELLGRGVLGPMEKQKQSAKVMKGETKKAKVERRKERKSAVEENR